VKKLHSELRPLWANAGYHSKMGSAAVVPPPSPHFKRLYHLTSAEHAISDIVFSRLKIADLNQLNDPFELLGARFLNNRNIMTAVQAHKDRLAKEYGLLCLSEDWTDPVLWTHYGARHKGICLGLDVPSGLAEKVKYQEDRIQVSSDTLDDQLKRKLLLTKYKSWEYENEWRIPLLLAQATKEGALFFERLGNRIYLAEVILGARCTISADDVRRLVNKHHSDVETFQARLAKGSFNIVPDEATIPRQAKMVHTR
jgi:hypothetical protein